MKKLLCFLKPYWKESIFSPLFKMLEALFDLLVPLVVLQIMDVGIPSGNRAYIWKMCGILLAFAAVGIVCAVSAQYFAAKAAVGFSTDLRHAVFGKIQRFSYSQTDSVGTSTLITRMTSDINQLQSGVNMTLRLLLRSPIVVFGAMIMAFRVDVKGALVFAVLIPLLFTVTVGLTVAGIPLYRKVQQKTDRVTEITRENLTGVRVLRAFRKEQDEIRRFEKAGSELNAIQNFAGKIANLLNPITMVFVNFGMIAILLFGGKQVQIGALSVGAVVALLNYLSQILVELIKFSNTVFTVNRALACADRVEAVLETDTDMPDPVDSEKLNDDAISFEKVSLTYPGNAAPTLTEIDFRLPKGKTLGIIGSTGSGKSSVAGLIPGFYPATAGTVTVFGKPVASYGAKELREQVAFAQQKPILFRGTVRSNLLMGREDASEEELWSALETAQAKDFVLQKGGLDTPVEQKGRNFSGGQKQRLCLARALVRKAPVLILDDVSSALDYATDRAMRNALRNLPEHPTVILISQRTDSLQSADLILVLEEGHQVGLGTHEELLQSCAVYREIHQSQSEEVSAG